MRECGWGYRQREWGRVAGELWFDDTVPAVTFVYNPIK